MSFKKELLPYFIIIGIVAIIIFTAFYFSFFRSTSKPQPLASIPPKVTTFSPPPQDIDTQNLQYHPDSNIIAQTTDQASQQMIERDAAIGELISQLPYRGNFFTLEYSYETNSFTLTLSFSNQLQGNQEFDQFLKSNNIENINWLYNLKIVNQ
jgi:hypothetical protein